MTPCRWMTSLFMVFALAFTSAAWAGDENLIEYSYGGFTEAGQDRTGPMLLPPIVKIYRDGRIVFLDERGLWQGRLGERELRRYEARLAAEPLLKATGVIPVEKGAPAGLHGGMAYIRYLDGREEVVVGAMILPKSGRWSRVISELRSHIPTSYSTFKADSVSVQVLRQGRRGGLAWPFGDELPLLPHVDRSLEIRGERMASFVLRHSRIGFSWLECGVVDGGQAYSLIVSGVPGWYEPSILAIVLGSLASEANE